MREVTKCDTLGGINGVAKRDTIGGIGMNGKNDMGVSESIVVYQFSVCAGVLLREIGSETAMVKEGKHDKDKNIL